MNFLLRPLKCTLKPLKNRGLRVYRFTHLHNYITKPAISVANLAQILTNSVKRIFHEALHIPSIFLILCTSFLVFPPCSVFLSVFCHNMTPNPHDNRQSPTRPQPITQLTAGNTAEIYVHPFTSTFTGKNQQHLSNR